VSARGAVAAASRTVVKVGSSSLTTNGRIDAARIDGLVATLAERVASGGQVVLVQQRQYVVQEAAKILPLLILRKLRLNLAGADFEGGEQIQRPVTFVSAFQPAHYFTAVGLHITGEPFDHLDAWLLIHAQYHCVERRVQI
jgi:hypothetical protein